MSVHQFPKKKSEEKSSKSMDKFAESLQDSDLALGSFKKEYRKLKKQMGAEKGDFSSEKAAMALLRAYMVMIVNMMPVLQKKFHTTGRGVYEVTNLAQISIEIANILQNMGDKNEQAQSIVENVIDPNLALMMQNLTSELEGIRKEVGVYITKSSTRRRLRLGIDKSLKNHAGFIGAIRGDIQAKLTKALKV